jgi:hypothetical protein
MQRRIVNRKPSQFAISIRQFECAGRWQEKSVAGAHQTTFAACIAGAGSGT